MSKTASSEEEALLILEDFKKKPPSDFCPLIASLCNKNCVCYENPYFKKMDVNQDKGKFLVYEGYCSNGMFMPVEINI